MHRLASKQKIKKGDTTNVSTRSFYHERPTFASVNMKIEQRGNSYRIRQMYRGKAYSINLPYKPTQKEAIQLMAQAMASDLPTGKAMTFARGYEDYIASKSHVLSPATIRGYDSCYRAIPDHFKAMRLNTITQMDVQKVINEYASDHSPKSVRNIHGLISAILGAYNPSLVLRTTLPQKEAKKGYIPSDSDISALLERAQGTPYEACIWLGCCGLRRSEILALTPEDIEGNIAHVNKALVRASDGQWIIKATKTTDSTRDVCLPDYVVELIKRNGAVYTGAPNSIFVWMDRTLKELGLPHFSFHALRHFYCSMSHSLGIPDAYIQQAGGWRTDSVMKNVYRHALQDKVAEHQSKAVAHLDNLGQNFGQNFCQK